METTSRSVSHLSSASSLSLPSDRKLKRKRAPIIDDEEPKFTQLEECKVILHEVIDRVLKDQPVGYSLAQITSLVERLCKFKHAELKELLCVIYEKIDEAFNLYELNLSVRDANIKHQCPEKEARTIMFCESLLNDWINWQNKLSKLSQIFGYIDRNYLKLHSWKTPIKDYGISKFTITYLIDDIDDGVTNENYELIKTYHERLTKLYYTDKYVSQNQESTKIQEIFKSLTTLLDTYAEEDTYSNQIYIAIENSFEQSQLKGWFSSSTEFKSSFKFQQILLILNEEMKLNAALTHMKDLQNYLIWSFILSENLEDIIQDDFDKILNNPHEMKILKEICSTSINHFSIDGILKLISVYSNYAEKLFTKTIADHSNIIPTLYQVVTDLNNKTKMYFKDDDRFEYEARKKLQIVINNRSTNPIILQHLVKYCDSFLRSKLKAVDNFFDIVLVVFNSLSNKDQFLNIYKKELSRRLLISKSLNLVNEKKLIELFEKQVGSDTTLNKLIEDIESATTTNLALGSSNMEFTKLLLKYENWTDIPEEDFKSITLPKEFATLLADSTQGTKKLDWTNYKLHKLAINGTFGGKDVIINCNLLQALIILLFNEKDEITIEEILKITNMNVRLLNSILQTFSGSSSILVKKDASVIYNKKFKSKSGIVNLPIIKDYQLQQVQNQPQSTTPTLDQPQTSNKKFESIIIKTMKQAKEMSYIDLLNKCMDQLGAPINVGDLKSSIEKLINNEYLNRKDFDIIVYIP
ncbi:hypothetical protein KGF54_001436 [Candida jiufengensis]|uniref:uncharacterized protein n=1 Tax=Candida jiufengensis TaxID=497108 RepID=UPI0022243625|nr:uncharacterized protein KGF54_001436 [Candida jiufengensis]KAI5955934.1 hypothetical protein KGF54_001436 [Candida jiufengensis]